MYVAIAIVKILITHHHDVSCRKHERRGGWVGQDLRLFCMCFGSPFLDNRRTVKASFGEVGISLSLKFETVRFACKLVGRMKEPRSLSTNSKKLETITTRNAAELIQQTALLATSHHHTVHC